VSQLKTNNVTRFLDSHKVHYDVFELPPEKLGALETAEFLDVPVNLVYKSIILMQPNSKPILCMVPGNAIVNLKEVAVFLGQKPRLLAHQLKERLPDVADADERHAYLFHQNNSLAQRHKDTTTGSLKHLVPWCLRVFVLNLYHRMARTGLRTMKLAASGAVAGSRRFISTAISSHASNLEQ
jgi:prolyl-tRNA editing enzyme YbaK/EbsC (Cys-tRNA(Pro) deacylase)